MTAADDQATEARAVPVVGDGDADVTAVAAKAIHEMWYHDEHGCLHPDGCGHDSGSARDGAHVAAALAPLIAARVQAGVDAAVGEALDEVERLRGLNTELVSAHNALLAALTRSEDRAARAGGGR